MAHRRGLLTTGLTNYYRAHVEVLDVLRDLLAGTARLSLRLLDYFITTYSKDNGTIILLDAAGTLVDKGGAGEKLSKLNVHQAYRAQLQAYGKAMFDPFRRRERITFAPVAGVAPIETTVGQLNCVRWLHASGVLQYVEAHAEDIESGMKGGDVTPVKTLVKGFQTLSFA